MSRLGSFSGLGSYYGLSDALLQGQSQRYDRSDYDDHESRLRDIDRRRSEYRDRRDSADDYTQYRDVSPRRSSSRLDRYSPKPQRTYETARERQASWSEPVSYPLAHVGLSRSSDRTQDRGHNQNRNHNRSTSLPGDSRGYSNQGPGILGAKPGDRLVPEIPSLPGIGAQGLTAQLAQQQQQLMAMVQTQSLLAAMQGQLKQGIGLLPNALNMPQGRLNQQRQFNPQRQMNQPRQMNQQRQMGHQRQMYQQRQMNRKRPGSQTWGDGAGAVKRDRVQGPQNRLNQPQQRQNQQQNQQRLAQQRPKPKQTRWSGAATGATTEKRSAPDEDKRSELEKKEEEEENASEEEEDHDAVEEEAGDEEEEEEGEEEEEEEHEAAGGSPVPEESAESQKVLNFAGQDVDALTNSMFDSNREKYICQDCKIICIKEDSFRQHLMGRRHVSMIIEKAGKTFNYEQFRKFGDGAAPPALSEKVEHEENVEGPEKTSIPEVDTSQEALKRQPTATATKQEDLDFVKYTFDTRKTAVKEGDAVTISSVTKARVRITGFTSGRHMYGCEFVKAVAGFNCRLCKAFIRCGNDVTQHIRAKKHKRNYELYLQEHPNYEEEQKTRNRELDDVLVQREGQEVVLYEVSDEDTSRKRRKDSQNSSLSEVEVTKFVLASKEDDPDNMEEEDDDDEDDDGEKEDGAHADSVHEKSELSNPMDEVDDELEREIAAEDGVKLEDPAKNEFPSPEITVKAEPMESSSECDQEQDTSALEQPQEPSPSTRRARRSGGRLGTGRGRGRGRGARRGGRGARQSPAAKREVKKEGVEDDATADEDGLMAGFQVIDEIGDAEED